MVSLAGGPATPGDPGGSGVPGGLGEPGGLGNPGDPVSLSRPVALAIPATPTICPARGSGAPSRKKHTEVARNERELHQTLYI